MRLKTCPECGSADISLYMGGSLGMQYRCKTCGYTGALIVESDIDKKFKK